MQSSISGAAIALPFYHDAFLQVQDNSPSGPWLFPSAGLWAGDTLVETNSRNYSATPEDYEALLVGFFPRPFFPLSLSLHIRSKK